MLAAFVAAGALFYNAAAAQEFNLQTAGIYNLIWLDAWALLFVTFLFVLWHASTGRGQRHYVVLWSLAFFGFLGLSLIFIGTKFPENGYWGDEKFHIAMVQRFMQSFAPADYYYHNLPAFYPPIYFYLLALLGKIGNHPAYATLQLGTRLLFLAMPFALYHLWRKVVSPTRALLVTCAVMLVDMGGNFMLVNVPYAFLANSLFVPWWLHYLEGIGDRSSSRIREWAIGAVLGAFLFSTYFYPFFILALWFFVRITATVARIEFLSCEPRRLVRAGAILAGAAVISSPYWIPVIRSMYRYGVDRSRGDWHHAGSPGLNFPFFDLTPIGIILLVALGSALWRNRARWVKPLVLMLGTVLLYFLVGSVMGAMDQPVNLIKSREFSWAILAPLVGFAGYAVYARARARKSIVFFAHGVAIIAIVLTTRGLSTFAQSSPVATAKRTQVPSFGISADAANSLPGSVVLTSNEEFFAFYPAYAFICVNEHYSHPASRFIQRYDFLNILQRVRDPWLFHLALRHNVFDPVDYVMPEKRGESYYFATALSTYPDKLKLVETKFDATLLGDTTLFTRLPGPSLHKVLATELVRSGSVTSLVYGDSVPARHEVAMISARLDSVGREELKQAAGAVLSSTEDCMKGRLEYTLTPRLILVGCSAFPDTDGIHVAATVRVNRPMLEVLRMYLHVYPETGPKEMLNIEFPPGFDTHSWNVGDLISIDRTIPSRVKSFGFTLGFFSPDGPVGRAFDGHFDRGDASGQLHGSPTGAR